MFLRMTYLNLCCMNFVMKKEHEMSFPQEERNKIMTALHEDVQFLESINMTNYSLIVAITQRTLETSLQLPGKMI